MAASEGLSKSDCTRFAGLDVYIVFKIIQTELPVLKENVQQIIREELMLSTFDRDEMNVARESAFYSHVDFCEIIRE